jgi:hypothetical protein
VKGALKAAAALAVLAVLAWTGTYIYWHIRIMGTLRTLETQSTSAPSGSSDTSEAGIALSAAGCRAFPYIVGALDPAKNPYFLARVSARMAIQVSVPGATGFIDARDVSERWKEWYIDPGDSVPERAAKCEAMRAWWRLHGSEYHQTWRIWSRACAAK